MIDPASLFIAFSIGILGGAHCIGMCGGIMGVLTMAVSAQQDNTIIRRWQLVLLYNLGRIVSYLIIATLFYTLIASVEQYFAWYFMRIVSGVLLVAMGLYLANWWRGLVYLEKVGSFFWRYLQPLSKKLLPVSSLKQALALGMLWGWLPCGLIYSALVYSATAPSVTGAILIMFAFALGTLPAVMATGLLAERLSALIQQNSIRQLFAVLIIGFGVWTLWFGIGHH